MAVAGRITAHRDMGKSMFIDVRDQSGRLQVYAQKNVLGDEQFDIFRHLDLGDFIGARGALFTTKTGEISVKLASLRHPGQGAPPAPGQMARPRRHGDPLPPAVPRPIGNPEVKEVFLKRSAIIREIRNFLNERGYIEVETPMMQAIPGGAAAQPFITHHNALGCDFYLRIALELYLKRLLVGGLERVYELGATSATKGSRASTTPSSPCSRPTEAFGDYASMMEPGQGMICHVAQKVLGTLVITHNQDAAIGTAIEQTLREMDGVSTALTGTLLKVADGELPAAL